jgi:hypothetical protein
MNIEGFRADHVQITLDGPGHLGRRRLRTEEPGLRTKGADGDKYGLVPVEYRPGVRKQNSLAKLRRNQPCPMRGVSGDMKFTLGEPGRLAWPFRRRASVGSIEAV